MDDKEVIEPEVGEGLSLVEMVRTDVNIQGGRIRVGHVVPGVCKAMNVVRGLSHNEGTFRGRDLKNGGVSWHCGDKSEGLVRTLSTKTLGPYIPVRRPTATPSLDRS
jgi:hypothetical protein